MSYTSENEDENFFDAFDVTPMHSKSSLMSFDGQTDSLRGPRNKDSFSTHNKEGDIRGKELSFESDLPVILSYDTPINSESPKCSVVILEPDIVQSTKSSSLPRQQLPMATITPHKKKAKSADLPLYSPVDLPSSSKAHCLMPEGEGSGSITPKMPDCSSPVLDITSATKGVCLVSLCDQVQLERARRESGQSWDSLPSRDLSSTEDLLSTDHMVDEEDEDGCDGTVGGDESKGLAECSGDRKEGQPHRQQFSPTKFSTPPSSFSPLFAASTTLSATSTSTTCISQNLHSLHGDPVEPLQHHHSFRNDLRRNLSTTTSTPNTSSTTTVSSPKTKTSDSILSPAVNVEKKDEIEGEEGGEKDNEEDDECGDEDKEENDEGGDEEAGENVKSSQRVSDNEILNKTMVLNLDTGETLPLSNAEEKIPKCINPLSLHIMRRTKEYSSSDSNLNKQEASDNDTLKTGLPPTKKNKQPGRKRMRIKQFIGKTVNRFKSATEKNTHAEDTSTDDDDIAEHRKSIKIKNSHSHKGPYDFELLVPIQEIGDNKSGAIWTMKFSHCGRLLATGGQDGILRVWVLQDALPFFTNMRAKYSEVGRSDARPDSAADKHDQPDLSRAFESPQSEADQSHLPFHPTPFSSYKGHTADVLDISWSKNYFLLSSSMDKTVRLWHVSRWECLCCFQHIDFVTAISFHPKDDRYFLSGSLDGKLRLWNIPDKKVALWNEVVGPAKLITAANFCLNGRFAVVGTYDGRCIFYNSEHLKYFTQIHVRSTRGRNKRGRKITGVEPYPGDNKILVTSNDSRIRLYDLRDLTLACKFKGVTNNTSQIKANFSHDGKYVVCGSEDQFIYIWKTQHEFYKFSSARKDRNNYWEGIKAHSAVVTNAIFAPEPQVIIKPQFEFVDADDKANSSGVKGEVLVSADYHGCIRIFINKFKPPA